MNDIIAQIYTRLSGQLSEPVYDHVPQDTSDYPLVVMYVNQVNNIDDDTKKNNDLSLRVLCFSRSDGFKEVNALSEKVYAALHQWKPADTANDFVSVLLEQNRSFQTQPDGRTRYSVLNYRLYTDEQ